MFLGMLFSSFGLGCFLRSFKQVEYSELLDLEGLVVITLEGSITL